MGGMLFRNKTVDEQAGQSYDRPADSRQASLECSNEACFMIVKTTIDVLCFAGILLHG